MPTLKMITQLQLKIAQTLRQTLEKKSKRDNGIYNDNLCGYCAISTVALAKAFKKQGFPVSAFMGKYKGDEHCWLTCQGYIWDLTITQFDSSLPAVFTCKINAKMASNFKVQSEIDLSQAPSSFIGWPAGQIPKPALIQRLLHKTFDKLEEEKEIQVA